LRWRIPKIGYSFWFWTATPFISLSLSLCADSDTYGIFTHPGILDRVTNLTRIGAVPLNDLATLQEDNKNQVPNLFVTISGNVDFGKKRRQGLGRYEIATNSLDWHGSVSEKFAITHF